MVDSRKKYKITLILLLLLNCHVQVSRGSVLPNIDPLKDDFLNLSESLNGIRQDTLLLKSKLQSAIEMNDTVTQLLALNQLSNIYKSHNQYHNIFKSELDFLQLAQHSGSRYLAMVSMNRQAAVFMSINLFDEAARLYYSVLKESKEYDPNDSSVILERATALYGVGTIFTLLEANHQAYELLDKAHNLLDKHEIQPLHYQILLSKGKVMQNQQLYEAARQFFNEGLEKSTAINSRQGIGWTFLSFGDLELSQGNFAEAEVNLNNAFSILRDTHYKTELIKVCSSLGDAYVGLDRLSDAERFYLMGLELSNQLDLSYFQEHLNYKLSMFYKNQGKENLALHYFEQSHNYGRRLGQDKMQVNLFNAQMEYAEVLRKDELKELSDRFGIITSMQNLIIIASIVIILLLIILFFVRNRYLSARRERNLSMIESTKLKSEFYKQLSDEFRTPLAIIGGLAEKLKNTLDQGDSVHNLIDLELIEKQSKKLVRLVNEVLAVSNLKSGDSINWTHGNVVPYIRFLYSGFTEVAESKSIELQFHSSTKELQMDFSKENLGLVINNLVGYLLKQCIGGDKVAMLIREDEVQQKCFIEIVGTSEMKIVKELSESMNLFQHLDTEHVLGQKVDQLMSFFDYLVRGMNGKLSYDLMTPSRTKFIIELPIKHNYQERTEELTLEEDDSVTEVSLASSIQTNNQSKRHLPNILLVEANSDMAFYITSILKDKYNVIVVEDSSRTLTVASEQNIALIITAYLLPQINGNNLSMLLKKNFATGHIPILMITSKVGLEDRIAAIQSGVDVVIKRAFDEGELLATIENLIANREILRMKYGQMSVDISTRDKELQESYNEDIEFLQKVTDIIFREMQNSEFVPEGLAKEMHFSSSHFNRKIKELTGMNTMGFVNNIKLNRAKKLLAISQRPIGDIAMESGYSDFSYFSRSFKRNLA